MPKKKRVIQDYAESIIPSKFWAQVDVKSESECWNWKRAKNTTGYGLHHIKSPSWLYDKTGRTSTQLLAHRVAYYLHNKDIGYDDTMNYICHTCDNRTCCNPLHLFIGSQLDNMNDMYNKGRVYFQKNRVQ